MSEDQIRAAMFLAYERMKIVLEPSACVGIAVSLSDEFRTGRWGDCKRVGVILCGGLTHGLILILLPIILIYSFILVICDLSCTGNVDLLTLDKHFRTDPAA